MSELPSSWETVDIELISEIVSGGTPSSSVSEYYTDDHIRGIAWVTPADLSGYKRKYIAHGCRSITEKGYKSCSAKLMPKGSVLFSSRAPIGYVAIAENEISTNQGFKSFVPEDGVESGYLYYYLKSIKHLAESLATGTTFKELSGKVAKTLPFPLAPRAEQTRIVEKLDEVLAQVDTIKARLDGIPAILKRFRQSVLAAAVSGRLTKTLSKWRNEKLKDCFDCIDGDRGPNYPKKEEYLTEGYCLFLSTKNVRNFGFDFNEKIFITKEKDEILRKGRLERGDLVITTRGTLGYVASYDMTVPHEVVRINSGMLILRKKDPEFINDYFKILIASPYFQKQIEIQRTGSAQPQLPANVLKEFELPVPSYEEQKEIVLLVDQYFTFADTIEAQVKKAQARVDNLTQSILAKAFRGELVAQDPDDEPAEKLLERIAQARKEAEALAQG